MVAKAPADHITLNSKDWNFLLTFGYSLDIYARGRNRVGIDSKTGNLLIAYKEKPTQEEAVKEYHKETPTWRQQVEQALREERERIARHGI